MSVLEKKIAEFEQGEKVEGFYLIKSIICKVANNSNKKYLDIILSDKTGEISAKIWEVTDENENLYNSNEIVKVRGTVTNWQGSLQLKVEKINKLESTDNIVIEDYVQTAPMPSEEMIAQIEAYVEKIKDDEIRILISTMIDNNRKELMYYPAAKRNHHSLRGGLLYHILTMLKLGESIATLYDFLNVDLIYAGIILHDLAKIKEMRASELGIVDEYTLEGTLLGHITQGIKEVEVVGRDLGIESNKLILIQHMILSHHYEPEYGSPVKPMIAEAEMLHYIDTIDARMYDMQKLKRETKVGEFSERLWSLENRRIYNHGLGRED
ncbi:3'-5' exoribonuclease YhaM family protein [Clostridium mediterraneense]|uniref:3'-5' exoribonuclease YhaM family protein n=1 Tax=Clostridium mediterraneense TaxID=1805472 RepID=UPI00082C9D4D|nr:HD domain-containing protein [Clostridium mediterraneense]